MQIVMINNLLSRTNMSMTCGKNLVHKRISTEEFCGKWMNILDCNAKWNKNFLVYWM